MTRAKLRHRRSRHPSLSTSALVALRPPPLLEITPGACDDDQLLARARLQWQQGDWEGLAQTPLSSIEGHPQRARLALLLAAGHQQLGRVDAARRCANQALDWGCERRAVAQVLISGIHSSLARAADLGDDAARSRRHLEAALAIAYPGQDVQALVAQRQLQQRAQAPRLQTPDTVVAPPAAAATPPQTPPARLQNPDMAQTPERDDDPLPNGNPDGSESSAVNPDAATAPAAADAARLPPGVATQMQRTTNLLRRLHQELATTRHDLAALRQHLDLSLQRQASQQSQLMEAYFGIARAVDGLPPLPSFQRWAVSADLGAQLMDDVVHGGHDAIIEFGSGSSTLLMALACARRQHPPLQLALEHLPEHRDNTLALLARHAPGQPVQVALAPLLPWAQSAEEPAALFYDGHAALQALAAQLAARSRGPRLLVLVDGPPASTGPQARYPALAHLLQYFPAAEVDCYVDDYGRPDDRAVVERWVAELQASGRPPTLDELPFVKAACHLHWPAPALPA